MVIVVTFTGIGTSGLPELAAATLVAGFAATIGFGLVGEGESGADAAASAVFPAAVLLVLMAWWRHPLRKEAHIVIIDLMSEHHRAKISCSGYRQGCRSKDKRTLACRGIAPLRSRQVQWLILVRSPHLPIGIGRSDYFFLRKSDPDPFHDPCLACISWIYADRTVFPTVRSDDRQ
jgi:hypothetical protein